MSERPHITQGEPAGIVAVSLLPRVLTAVGYAVVVLASLIIHPLAAGVVFGIMAGLAAQEFYAMERREYRLPNEFIGVGFSAFMPIAAALWGLPGLSSMVTALVAISLVWHTMFRRTRTADTAITVFGTLYTGFLLAYMVLILKTYEAGRYLAVILVVSVWANDVFAYFFGSLLGRHKLAPHISPKKSWEGFLAGAVGAIAVWVASPLLPGFEMPYTTAALVGASVALASVVGDLAESRMKREAGVKDSGNSLPGHGGFLDRLDSLILVCLVAYWVLWWSGVR